jgi:hypothetical protein
MIKVKYLADVFVEGEPRTAGESYDEHPDTAAQMVRLRRAEVVAGESAKPAKKAKPESAE